MKLKLIVALLMVSLSWASCSSTSESSGVWVNREKITGKKFNKVMVVVMTADIEARAKLETDLAAEATSRGYQAIKSIDVMPPSLQGPEKPSKEALSEIVRKNNCDGVVVSTLLRKEEDVRYVPGSTAYTPMPYYSYYGNFWGYYNHWYPSVYTPGYYTNDKSYFMQTNLYDVASEELMWSVQSELFNPTSLAKFSKRYTKSVVQQLQSEGLLK